MQIKKVLQRKIFFTSDTRSPWVMEPNGMTFDHDFYVVVGKQCRTEIAYKGHQHNIFIKQINNKKKHLLIYIKILCW